MKTQTLTAIVVAAVTTLVVIAAVVLLMPLLGPRYLHPMMMGNQPAPNDLDTSASRLSDSGTFLVAWQSDSDQVPLNAIHTWTLTVKTPEGEPVENATILIDGGMPQHGHGLPTSPQVTEYLGDGQYRLEGLKFQMPGWWQVYVTVTSEGITDAVTFNLILP